MKVCKILALMFVAPAVFGETRAALPAQSVGQIKILRGEIRRDQVDLTEKTKATHADHAQLLASQKSELDLIRKSGNSRPNRVAARKAVLDKYAKIWADRRRSAAAEKKSLREDIAAKKNQIRKLRQS